MIDDVGFLSQFLDRIEADYPIDPARVFVTGVSNGAMMAYYFACQRADRVAAVGSVAGAMVLDSCHPSRPVSVIEVHGTADPEVPYLGGQAAIDTGSTFAYPSSQAVAQRWVAVDGCDPQATGSSAGPVMTAVWTRCQAGSAVSLVSVAGGGHVWFAPGLGPSDGALDATMVIWRFFNSLPVK
jgi:polyhydroxybutyrate depolymerase